MSLRRRDSGFSLMELMVVVVIIGILSAIAVAMVGGGRDRRVRDGREFASEVARYLQRGRLVAVGERVIVSAWFFSDRVLWVKTVPPAVPVAPTAPTWGNPFQVINAPAGVVAYDVTSAVGMPLANLTLTTAQEIRFLPTGQAQRSVTLFQPAYAYVENGQLAAGHLERRFRIDVTPLTGFVSIRESWP